MGSKISIWRQGKAFPNIGKKIIEFDHQIYQGPSDDRVKIAGFDVHSDKNGDFISDSYSDDELDAIHTFGVARIIIELFEKALKRPIHWSWENKNYHEPITINIKNNDINARYLKDARCIELDYYGPIEKRKHYCHSVDIIAHETGHAILDGLKPFWENSNIETRGLAEAFCDLTAMFFITNQLDLCDEVIKETRGDLDNNSILTEFGAGFGTNQYSTTSIRSAKNNRIYNPNLPFTYDFDEVLIGGLYDLLCAMIERRSVASAVLAKELFETGHFWQVAIIKAFDSCYPENSSLSDFVQQLTETLSEEQDLVKSIFSNRGIIINQ